MAKKKRKEISESPVLKIQNFYRRWNIDLDENEKWRDFRDRAMNGYEEHIGKHLAIRENAETEFFKLIGKHQKSVRNFYDSNMIFDTSLAQSPSYNYLLDEVDIKKFFLVFKLFSGWTQLIRTIKMLF
jgi:hypothetical protein